VYLALDKPRRLQCFRRLCKVALAFRRYRVMGDVRLAYGKETNAQTQTELRDILDEEDPRKTIEGRAVIPR
jgi:hypothetical protein